MIFREDINTRKIYKFEREYFWGEPSLPMKMLQDLANRIWESEGKEEPLPRVVSGKGTKYSGRYFSYFDGEKIELARSERKRTVLIHEMVHALGYDKHDDGFACKYFELLEQFAGCSRRELLYIGIEYKLVEEPEADIW
jgi:hypothetical protein